MDMGGFVATQAGHVSQGIPSHKRLVKGAQR